MDDKASLEAQPSAVRHRSSWYSRLLLLIVLLAVAYFIVANRAPLAQYEFRVHWAYIGLAFLVAVLEFLLMLGIWVVLSGSFGIRTSVLQAGEAWFLSCLGKYVPGKVALLLVRMDAYQGHSRRKIAVATGVEHVATIAAACILSLGALLFTPTGLPAYVRWAAAGCALALLVLLWPPLLKRLVNFGFRLIRREPLDEMPSYFLILKCVGAYVLTGLLGGFGMFLVLNAFAPVSVKYYLAVTSCYYVSAIIGLLALFAPAGIGVREGVLFFVLSEFIPDIPRPAVIVGGITMRLVGTAAELLLAGAFVTLHRASKRARGHESVGSP